LHLTAYIILCTIGIARAVQVHRQDENTKQCWSVLWALHPEYAILDERS